MSNDKSFIEVQFPVSKISKESYKERKAASSQTLTGLGKWWGRKPLVLVRAALLGLLMPVSEDYKKDREVFLKILTMDEDGLWRRKEKVIPIKVIYENLTLTEKKRYCSEDERGKVLLKKGISKAEKEDLQRIVFNRLSYDEKIKYCVRPEEVENIDTSEWEKINQHLGTKARNIQELIQQLGKKKYGRYPVVGDCFSGGGSIPFEAARIGCDVYASDLNPIAAVLTWSALKINGCDENEIRQLEDFQQKIYKLADQKVTQLGIEHNEDSWRGVAYLYCNETICPECGYKVPLATSWHIGKGTNTVAILKERDDKVFDIEIITDASEDEINEANRLATVVNYQLRCPHCKAATPIPSIRKDKIDNSITYEYRYSTPNDLRKWENDDVSPRQSDIFTERLYCIRYEETYEDDNGNIRTVRHYATPSENDLIREKNILSLLKEKLPIWQEKGYIPNTKIEAGNNTNQVVYEKGWTHWHHLFNPRQLLIHGLLMELIDDNAKTVNEKIIGLLAVNKCCNWNSKLSIWDPTGASGVGVGMQTFNNQALNTIFNYSTRSIVSLYNSICFRISGSNIQGNSFVELCDARSVGHCADMWITDPPYADSVHYHELSEFFLAWDKKFLLDIFPHWYGDSKRVLAVKGTGEGFNNSMIEVYRNLADNMPDNGMQVVMFTHQDVSVWAELTMILWSAGLQVTAAWNIATETDASGIKQGNYVKGTVLLVLRKQTSEDTAYLDELYPEIEEEVMHQIDSMRILDDKEDPNFNDADYLLAAYAASLKVLTSYRNIEDINVKYELTKTRVNGEESPIERVINEAVKIAYDYLIPSGFDSFTWKSLIAEERFYIKGIDLEKSGVYQMGAYQELARGFGVKEYLPLLASTRANQARLKTALEFGMRGMGENDRFGQSILRNVLAALNQSIKEEDTSMGRNWIKNELSNYWQQRNAIVEILDYISTLGNIENMGHWEQEANYAKLLRELIKNDGV